jgi:hypothetical protein
MSAFVEMMSELYPAMGIAVPVVEHLRIHYWLKLREIAT